MVVVTTALWLGLALLRDPTPLGIANPTLSKLGQAVVAIFLGVVGIWGLFYAGNTIVEALPGRATRALRPYLFVLPAIAVVGLYLVYPTIGTVAESFTNVPEGEGFFHNYINAFTNSDVLLALRNNLIWLLVAPAASLAIGLAFAALVDRIRSESFAKSLVFMPLAISFVGASVIWQFIYAWKPPGQPQIGVLNALWVWAGGFFVDWGILEEVEPIAWLQLVPWTTLALIAIMIWLQVGFAMVVLSAAIKGVPTELTEAARIDGATELQAFFRITVPSIRGAILTVYTTIAIAVLKIFDIIFVTTGGNFDTEVVAVRMYQEMFRFRNFAQATTMAVILLVAVLPIAVVNIRNLRRSGVGR
ncbi:MAG: sugar ABC transporter permease [Actinobacteria bacterium]|nr:sugar ABC transporter permease [Actinomycetota bacterium]MCI0679696.1 sugar ABC transporter permease [Actinomycetota bacterium]